MSKSNAFETALLQLLFTNSNASGIGDATGLRGSSTAGSFYFALWIGDPGEDGAGGAEASYTGYARQAVARSSGGFTVTGNQVVNAADVNFPAMTGGTGGTATHGAIMTAPTGGTMICSGPLSPNITLNVPVAPGIAAGQFSHTED